MWHLIMAWLETYVWPWKAIASMRKERDNACWKLSNAKFSFDNGYTAHWKKWIANAANVWGQGFDYGQINVMRSFYDEGESYRMAVVRLRMTMRIPPYEPFR